MGGIEYVSGDANPRTPMGPAGRAPFGSVGGQRPREEQIKARHTGGFTQLRAARMRKTLLLLVCVYWILAQERQTLPD